MQVSLTLSAYLLASRYLRLGLGSMKKALGWFRASKRQEPSKVAIKSL